ncbi:acyltransferase family protein [Cylindrospermum sp. FACHB-282]|uniref:acyltransferase family protein n=1 Tax=Cylindrospermum sp. FACHB-282 TaxID=2692794 RepID=UPI00168434F1|nr:acyltransferase [Cylindrospermum sp. FACHB-282]MBD2385317.1 acyltransferase [Cylindrospermum sp. FACHB-282]
MNFRLPVSEDKNQFFNSSRSQLFEVIRALAIIWIAWYHVDQLILPINQNIFSIRTLASLGYSGVNIFLLLSGIGLTLGMKKERIDSAIAWSDFPWKKFFLRRFLRIYPLYIVAHILFFITGALVGKYSDMPLDIGFLLSITGLRVFFPKYFWYGPDAFWFVGLILQFYFLFPVLFLLMIKINIKKFLLITFFICAISRLITAGSVDNYVLMLGLAPNRLAEFCLGMTIAYNTSIDKGLNIQNITLKNPLIWITFLVSTVGGIFLYWTPVLQIKTIAFDLILAIAAFTGLTIIALMSSYISYIYQILAFLGSISYSFYLLHSPPIRPAFSAMKAIGIQNYWVTTLIYLSSIVLFSYILTYCESRLFSRKR